eukprot:CAMPEP_0183719612 /NCGR_PEP_ID=MMETSP0737-20130205/12467_1 /TAXON_ID=385413 /ORGANISM="Thalassiosira miniscula, Strain CCMP1093" /LENGTH=380 /DNA_ID=CAMNT_0025949333 /DNA_START=9 /DNA_END=1151 /DNA_ORIENTATION=+
MMQAAPADGSSTPVTEDFDTMSSSNLEDLALTSENESENAEAAASAAAAAATTDAAAAPAAAPAANTAEEEADPWAVLAAAAGEEAPQPPPAATPANTSVIVADANAPPAEQPGAQLMHSEGETFAMPGAPNSSSQERPSFASQLQSSTANLSATLTTKLAEVNAKTGISTKAKSVDEQYHLTEKWTSFKTDVIAPTTTRTVEKTKEVSTTAVEKTKEVSTSVKEKVAPHWGAMRQRTTEIGIAQKWSSLSSVTKTKWNESKEKVGENIEHWKEEQERKKALANSGAGDAAAANGGAGGVGDPATEKLKKDLEATKEKVVESWTGGVNWVSQRIKDAKLSQELNNNGNANNSAAATTTSTDQSLNRLDSDGLPSSFRKDF